MENYQVATGLVKALLKKSLQECTAKNGPDHAREVYAHATLGTLQACIMISMSEFPETVEFWRKELERAQS